MQNQKGISTLIVIIIIIAVAVVAVGGVFAYQYFTTNTQPINQTAGWKTYTSTSYGFEIKYPQSWEVLVNSSSDISFRDKKYDGSYEWPGLDMVWTPTSTDPSTNESKIFKAENAKNGTVIVHFTNEGKRPIFATCKLYLDPTVINTCNQMLSTLKFTTPTDQTAGWKTYTNDQYGFEFQYPSDFANVDDLTTIQKNSLTTYMRVCNRTETGLCYIGTQTSDGFAAASFNITVQSRQQTNKCPIGELTKQTIINDINFYQDKIEDAALGHYVTGDSYRIYQNGVCYTIDLNIESDRGTLEKGLSADFSSMMNSKLKSILSTFKFTTPTDQTAGIKTGKITIDYQQVKTLQASVDQGSQPWRLNPESVVRSDIIQYGFVQSDLSSLKLTSHSASAAVNEYEITHNGKTYTITVIQTVPGSGQIWVISDIELK